MNVEEEYVNASECNEIIACTCIFTVFVVGVVCFSIINSFS